MKAIEGITFIKTTDSRGPFCIYFHMFFQPLFSSISQWLCLDLKQRKYVHVEKNLFITNEDEKQLL